MSLIHFFFIFQGAFVSLIFCIFNGEVCTLFKTLLGFYLDSINLNFYLHFFFLQRYMGTWRTASVAFPVDLYTGLGANSVLLPVLCIRRCELPLPWISTETLMCETRSTVTHMFETRSTVTRCTKMTQCQTGKQKLFHWTPTNRLFLAINKKMDF